MKLESNQHHTLFLRTVARPVVPVALPTTSPPPPPSPPPPLLSPPPSPTTPITAGLSLVPALLMLGLVVGLTAILVQLAQRAGVEKKPRIEPLQPPPYVEAPEEEEEKEEAPAPEEAPPPAPAPSSLEPPVLFAPAARPHRPALCSTYAMIP